MSKTSPGTVSAPLRLSARDRLLAAADELFYEEGVNIVGIDRVIERAGVAKASLYDSFGSKEELIRSYLQARHDRRVTNIEARLAQHSTPREKILAVYEYQRELIQRVGYHGCAFVRASAEARPGSSVKAMVVETRDWTLALFTRLAKEAGAKNPQRLGEQLVLLYDGALLGSHIDSRKNAADTARATAEMLLGMELGQPAN